MVTKHFSGWLIVGHAPMQGSGPYLLLDPPPPLLELGGLHGRGPASGRLARLSIGVDHPPRGLASPLVLNSHEAVVEREVMSDRVLKQDRSTRSVKCSEVNTKGRQKNPTGSSAILD